MKYDVKDDFWHRGRLVRADEVISLTDKEAKYLKHVLKPKPKVEAAIESVPDEEPAPTKPFKYKRGRNHLQVEVVEASVTAESEIDGDV